MRKKWEGGQKTTVGEDAMIKIPSVQMQSDYLLQVSHLANLVLGLGFHMQCHEWTLQLSKPLAEQMAW